MHLTDPLVARAGRWRAISGKTLLFPVIGHPAAQVRAPAVLNALFAEAGIDAVAFGLDLHPDQAVATSRGLLGSTNVGGLLVTVPYKQTLVVLADSLGEEARLLGTVNALRAGPDGRIQGELFDGHGFLAGLLAAGHAVAGRRVLLLGAGGAGSAIAGTLAEAGVASLAIHDPQPTRAEALAGLLRARCSSTDIEAHNTLQPAGFDIVVNASPLGLRANDPLPVDPALLSSGTLVCDAIMEPAQTRLLAQAAARGLQVHGGRPMFDHQVGAYLSFFGWPELAARLRILPQAITLQAAP